MALNSMNVVLFLRGTSIFLSSSLKIIVLETKNMWIFFSRREYHARLRYENKIVQLCCLQWCHHLLFQQRKWKGIVQIGSNFLQKSQETSSKGFIFERVTSVCLVCSLWWNIYKDPLMWRTIQMTNRNADYNYYVTICRYAIERICGYLEDINIEFFGAGDLLRGISNW